MFERCRGQETVKGGTYLNYKTGEFASVDNEGGILPGGFGERYVKMPLPLMLVFGPLLGLAFILFLPAAGIVVMAMFIVRAGARGLAGMRREAVKTAMPAAVGVAYLQRARDKETEGDATVALEQTAEEIETLVIELEEEIRQRRHQGEK